jgi:hypothetical protein
VFAPGVTVWLDGLAFKLKSGVGGEATTSVAVVECTSVPFVPVIVNVDDAAGVLDAVVTVSVDVLVVEVGLVELGLKVPVAPAGSPDTLKATDPAKPLVGVTVTV